MKNLILSFVAIFSFVLSTQAQEVKNKNAKVDIEVKGNCDMCKKRIEKAAFKVKGVKTATWHADDQTLHLIIDENKTSTKQVQEAVAKTGHDTKYKKDVVNATNEAYESLHGCCIYERES